MVTAKLSQADIHLTPRQETKLVPHASTAGSVCLVIGCATAFIMYPQGDSLKTMAQIAAEYVGMGFVGSILFDLQKGLRNLLRTDVLCLFGIYALTLAEFLFPQEDFNIWELTPDIFGAAINMTLLGILSFTLCRHLVKPARIKAKLLTLDDFSPNAVVIIVLMCCVIGFFNMLLAVNFRIFGDNPGSEGMIYHMMSPRFTQPWSRAGRLGGWNTLLGELDLLLYAIPPIMGVSINRLKEYGIVRFGILLACFALVILEAVTEGTRSVFITHVSTLTMSYLITVPKKRAVETLLRMVIPVILIFYLSSWAAYHMLEFRTMGMRIYLEEEIYNSEDVRDTVAVDYNLASMALIGRGMPSNYDYLGSEVIIWALGKSIPRAIWTGKPEGLSLSMEEVAGIGKDYTIAITFIGEAYMFAGWLGIILVSGFYGVLSAWWNRMAILTQSDYGLVVYSLGFFAAGLTMRSFFWTTTAILPVIALVLFRKFAPIK